MISGRLYDDFSAAELLAAVEAGVRDRRAEEVRDLLRCLSWVDRFGEDPANGPTGVVPAAKGGPRLVRVGGEGTPELVDLCLAELAVARSAGVTATRNAVADGLDLRHRLPNLWRATLDLRCEAWVARRVAATSRHLSVDQVALVDLSVADAVGQSPSRFLTIAAARILEAGQTTGEGPEDAETPDPDPRDSPDAGVWLRLPIPGGADPASRAGLASLEARLGEADAVWLDQTIEELATALTSQHPELSHQQRRARALVLLGLHHDEEATLTDDTDGTNTETADADTTTDTTTETTDAAEDDTADDDASDARYPAPPAPRPNPRRRRAVLHLHLHAETLHGAGGLARVDGVGPLPLDQVARLLQGAEVTVVPVVDLADQVSVNAYEHPVSVRIRTELRTAGDVFPHSAARPGAWVDHDHATPYDPTGPPGQTGDHNDAPLTRFHHRAKTHLGFRVVPLGPGRYLWITPHGLVRLVDHAGTHRPEPRVAKALLDTFGVTIRAPLKPAA